MLLLVLFAAPLAGAFWLYYGSSWRPALRTNHGELITPVTLPEIALPLAGAGPGGRAAGARAAASVLRGKWTLLVVGQGESGCDAALPQHAGVLTADLAVAGAAYAPGRSACFSPAIGLLRHSITSSASTAGLIALDASSPSACGVAPAARSRRAQDAGTIFIVDPLGNLMMRYDVRQDPKGLREDLKKLLELSHIG